MFAPIYLCPNHGKIWNVEHAEDIDTEHDEIYEISICPRCLREVQPLLLGEKPVLHILTDEEMFWETYS